MRLLSESCVGAVFVDCVADGEWVAANVIAYEKVALKAMRCETSENGDTGDLVILTLDEHGGHTLVHPETLFARQLFPSGGRARAVCSGAWQDAQDVVARRGPNAASCSHVVCVADREHGQMRCGGLHVQAPTRA